MKAVERKDKRYVLSWPCNEYKADIDTTDWKYGKLYEVNGVYYKIVDPVVLFDKLVKNNWDYAEPGILYWDRIQGYNLLDNTDFKYAGTNPCAEEPLPAGGSCLLGSLNLSEFVKNPFTTSASIDYDSLEKATFIAVTGLNQVLIEGLGLHPLEEQRESVNQWRQIGLGTLGLADMLIKMGITYGSEESLKVIDCVYKTIATSAIEQSLEFAKVHGCYPSCEKEKLVDSSFIKNLNLPKSILNDIKKYGLYNSQLLTCAPTGSIGTMLEVSTGVEPNFALHYTRKTQSLEGKDTYHEVSVKIVADYLMATENVELPDYFVTSADIKPLDRIKVQSVLQKYTDASISSTINLPKEATVNDIYTIYMEAWKKRLKGVTVYRSRCKREGILTVDTPKPVEIPLTKAPKRPKELNADFYTVISKGKQYIVLVGLLNNKPYEIFAFEPNIKLGAEPHTGIIVKKSKMHYSYKSELVQINDLQLANDNIEERAATLYASMLLRHGVNIKYIIKTAKKVNDNITSFSSALCRILAKYIPSEITGEKCPNCGGDIINEGGCVHCTSCEWSRCD
jgi:ribonucleotide reductase alpha subunit